MPATKPPFDPTPYLTLIKGKEYLSVQWRIFWFRDVWPNGTIQSDIVHIDLEKQIAVVKATVTMIDKQGNVRGWSTGYKTGVPRGQIDDFLELAETGAIGRALGNCGFGTQFSGVEYEPDEFIVDAPITKNLAPRDGQQPRIAPAPPVQLVTSKPANPTPAPAPVVDQETGEIQNDDAEQLDPDSLIDPETAKYLRELSREKKAKKLIDGAGIKELLKLANPNATTVEELTYDQAATLEEAFDGLDATFGDVPF